MRSVAAPNGPSCTPGRLPPEIRRLGNISSVVTVQWFSIEPSVGPALGNDDILFGRQVLALQIDAEGAVTSCSIVEEVGQARGNDGCAIAKSQAYAPRNDAAGRPVPFKATLGMSFYAHHGAPPPTAN